MRQSWMRHSASVSFWHSASQDVCSCACEDPDDVNSEHFNMSENWQPQGKNRIYEALINISNKFRRISRLIKERKKEIMKQARNKNKQK